MAANAHAKSRATLLASAYMVTPRHLCSYNSHPTMMRKYCTRVRRRANHICVARGSSGANGCRASGCGAGCDGRRRRHRYRFKDNVTAMATRYHRHRRAG